MKTTDMYRKFLEEQYGEFKELLFGFVKAIRDASELLPDEEIIASWKNYWESAGIVSARINGTDITFDVDPEEAEWTYQFEGKNYSDALKEYLKKHYGDFFVLHEDIAILATKTGSTIRFSICLDVPFDERDKFSGASWSEKFHEDFGVLVYEIKECLSDEAVKISVAAGDPSEKFYSAEIVLYFEQPD